MHVAAHTHQNSLRRIHLGICPPHPTVLRTWQLSWSTMDIHSIQGYQLGIC